MTDKLPPPPLVPTDLMPPPLGDTGPPEPMEGPLLSSLLSMHRKMDRMGTAIAVLTRLVQTEADEKLRLQAVEREQDAAIALIERRLLLAGISEAPDPNGHG